MQLSSLTRKSFIHVPEMRKKKICRNQLLSCAMRSSSAHKELRDRQVLTHHLQCSNIKVTKGK